MHIAQPWWPEWLIAMNRQVVGQISWLAPHSTAQDAACSLGRSGELGAAGSRVRGVQDAPWTRSARLRIVGGQCAAGWGLRREAAHPRAMAGESAGESVSLAHLRLLLLPRPRGYPEAGCAQHRCPMTASASLSAPSVLTAASQQRSGPTAATAPFALVHATLEPPRPILQLQVRRHSQRRAVWRTTPHAIHSTPTVRWSALPSSVLAGTSTERTQCRVHGCSIAAAHAGVRHTLWRAPDPS